MKLLMALLVSLMIFSNSSAANYLLELSSLNDPVTDISQNILKEAYKQIGYDLKIKKLPAERALIESNRGSTDGEVNRLQGINKKYVNLVMVSTPVNKFEGIAFTRDRVLSIDGWESLGPYKIVIRRGAKFAEKGTMGMVVYRVTTYEQVFKLLSIGRYDVGIASRLTGLSQIKKHNLIGIKAIEPPLMTNNLYHYLHKKHKDIVPKINAVLLKMRKEGIMAKIRNKYIKENF